MNEPKIDPQSPASPPSKLFTLRLFTKNYLVAVDELHCLTPAQAKQQIAARYRSYIYGSTYSLHITNTSNGHRETFAYHGSLCDAAEDRGFNTPELVYALFLCCSDAIDYRQYRHNYPEFARGFGVGRKTYDGCKEYSAKIRRLFTPAAVHLMLTLEDEPPGPQDSRCTIACVGIGNELPPPLNLT